MRVAGSYVMKFDLVLHYLTQTVDGSKHQRRILELIETARKHNAKWCGVAGHGLRLEDVGIDPSPQRVDLFFLPGIGFLKTFGDVGVHAQKLLTRCHSKALTGIVDERVSAKQ